MKTIAFTGFITLLLAVSGCNSMQLDQFDQQQPRLVLEEYFQGNTYAWGIVEDRFGNLREQFQVSIVGTLEDGLLSLDEHFVYSDGRRDQRLWKIQRQPETQGYLGYASDVLGLARGEVSGNALNWQYRMDLQIAGSSWRVRFDDWMWLQPGGVLINRAEISKWGIKLARVTLFFTKQAPL